MPHRPAVLDRIESDAALRAEMAFLEEAMARYEALMSRREMIEKLTRRVERLEQELHLSHRVAIKRVAGEQGLGNLYVKRLVDGGN